jgi:dephospho-CoA kinase
MRDHSDQSDEFFMLGIVGGVGSGKSFVARVFGELGCIVSDSDRAAREVIQRAAVRERLVEWWGPGVVNESGEVDRSAVAGIVFNDPAQRRRLEALTHPLILEERQRVVEAARRDGAPGVIVDAPLLLEAGLERECDGVVFVEATEGTRLQRVRRSRGWTEDEWRRREAAQMDVAEKRRRSDFVIPNDDGGEDRTRAAVKRVFDSMRERRADRREARPAE